MKYKKNDYYELHTKRTLVNIKKKTIISFKNIVKIEQY
jgi:hypothetical protein